jgi:protein-S-isoprenylcysteine O-methyltransferase Ste14
VQQLRFWSFFFLWLLAGPGVFLVALPQALHTWLVGPVAWTGAWWQWLALWGMANGAGLAGWSVWLFARAGQGTPLPLAPPTHFVLEGPYRFMRNPMGAGLLMCLAAEALLCLSWVISLYLVAMAVLVGWYVAWVEEPQLARRFGPCYHVYKGKVPRWLPRFTPL